jgi:hypothetical protein
MAYIQCNDVAQQISSAARHPLLRDANDGCQTFIKTLKLEEIDSGERRDFEDLLESLEKFVGDTTIGVGYVGSCLQKVHLWVRSGEYSLSFYVFEACTRMETTASLEITANSGQIRGFQHNLRNRDKAKTDWRRRRD